MVCANVALRPDQRIHDAQAVRSHKSQPATSKDFPNLALECRPFFSVFSESRRNNDGGTDLGIHTFTDEAGHRSSRGYDDGKIDRFGHFRDRGKGRAPQDLAILRVNGIDLCPEVELKRFARTACPTLPSRLVAPMTATVRGWKIASSDSRSDEWTPRESSRTSWIRLSEFMRGYYLECYGTAQASCRWHSDSPARSMGAATACIKSE